MQRQSYKKFSKVNDLAEVEKIITKRLVNNEIEKVKRVGLATLKDFCELHDMDTTGTTVSDIIKSMVKEGLLNDDMEIEIEGMGKALLTDELALYQKAKIEELIAELMAVLALEV